MSFVSTRSSCVSSHGDEQKSGEDFHFQLPFLVTEYISAILILLLIVHNKCCVINPMMRVAIRVGGRQSPWSADTQVAGREGLVAGTVGGSGVLGSVLPGWYRTRASQSFGQEFAEDRWCVKGSDWGTVLRRMRLDRVNTVHRGSMVMGLFDSGDRHPTPRHSD